MRLPLQIEGIIFRKKDNQTKYLLLKRTSNRGGFWQPITGGLEEGETLIESLKREIKEETGLKEIIRIIESVHYFEFSDPHLIKEYVFGVEVSPTEKIIIDAREHSSFLWCTFEEAIKLMKWEENKKAFEKLNDVLFKS